MQKRRSFTAEFKAKVAIEAIKEQQTLQDLAHKHGLHPNQLPSWK
jgi:transposase